MMKNDSNEKLFFFLKNDPTKMMIATKKEKIFSKIF